MSVLSNMVPPRNAWLLSTEAVAGATEELDF